jgi:hypothetical protein
MFKLIDYLDKLTVIEEKNTEYSFVCPVCGGHRLKYNKKSNAYACYTNQCKPRDIRNKLGYVYENRDEIKVSTLVIEEPIFNNKINYTYIDQEEIIPIKKGNKYYSKFIYNSDCVVERYDYIKDSKQVKDCYPKVKINGIWTYASSNLFGLYNDIYLKEKSTLIIVEGEKSANIFSSYSNKLVLSPPSFGWNNNYLIPWFITKSDLIENIIYFPDNDKSGHNKAQVVQKAAWSSGIACKIIDLSYIFSMQDSDDVVDLINRNENVNLILDNPSKYYV